MTFLEINTFTEALDVLFDMFDEDAKEYETAIKSGNWREAADIKAYLGGLCRSMQVLYKGDMPNEYFENISKRCELITKQD